MSRVLYDNADLVPIIIDVLKTADKHKVLPIVQAGEPVLRSQTLSYAPEIISPELCQQLIDCMRATMYDAPGVGLACPQVGIPLALAVLEDKDRDNEDPREIDRLDFRVICNPTYTPVTAEECKFYEGCLSVDGFQAVRTRWRTIHARWQDIGGVWHEEDMKGWPARIFQHETDHLSGELYIDKAIMRSLATNDNLQEFWCDDPIPTQAAKILDFLL